MVCRSFSFFCIADLICCRGKGDVDCLAWSGFSGRAIGRILWPEGRIVEVWVFARKGVSSVCCVEAGSLASLCEASFFVIGRLFRRDLDVAA